jgi:hypothetical protein
VALLEPICRQFAPKIASVDIAKARRVLGQVRAEAAFDRRRFNGYRGHSTSSH